MFFAQFAEPDPRLAHEPPAGEMDLGAHHPTSLPKAFEACGMARFRQGFVKTREMVTNWANGAEARAIR